MCWLKATDYFTYDSNEKEQPTLATCTWEVDLWLRVTQLAVWEGLAWCVERSPRWRGADRLEVGLRAAMAGAVPSDSPCWSMDSP